MEQQIIIQGQVINYTIEGEGKPVLLLHGWGCSTEIWKQARAFFSANHCVVAIDFPGFGKSPEPAEIWGIEAYTRLTEQFITALNLTDPVLVGHSFGGRVAILLSSRNPISKIVLVDAAGIKPRRKPVYYFRVYSYKLLKNLAKIPVVKLLVEPAFERYRAKAGSSDYRSASETMKRILSKVVNEDLTYAMPKIKGSALLFWGANDTATPLSDAKIMEKLIPDAGLVVYQGCGHYSFLERAADFHAVVSHFIQPKS